MRTSVALRRNGFQPKGPAIMEMEGKVIAEMQQLLAELKALGF
jgi:hypothetical protein